MCSRLVIQDNYRKVQVPSQEPGPWSGTFTHTTEVVYDLVPQCGWDKVRRLILELVEMEGMGKEGTERADMESTRGFLVYMDRTYWGMNPQLLFLHLNLDSWRPLIDNKGWRIHGEKLKLADMDRKWKNMEGGDKLIIVKGCSKFKEIYEGAKNKKYERGVIST